MRLTPYEYTPSRFLHKELEGLRNTDDELVSLQQELDEDTTEVIPSAM